MTEKQISLRDLRASISAMDRLVQDAWTNNTGHPAEISFDKVREHARAILALVGDSHPAAKDDVRKSAPLAAVTARVPAQDKAPAFDLQTILGLSHIRRGS